jgi:hypothetical protein
LTLFLEGDEVDHAIAIEIDIVDTGLGVVDSSLEFVRVGHLFGPEEPRCSFEVEVRSGHLELGLDFPDRYRTRGVVVVVPFIAGKQKARK